MDNVVEAIAQLVSEKTTDVWELKVPAPVGSKSIRHRFYAFLTGWRVVLLLGAIISGTVLVANISLLIWAEVVHGHSANDGILTVFQGDCTDSSNTFVWSHLAINVAGTLLLAASNAACQCLTAPTRADIDAGHVSGRWLDVGIPSFRNLWWIPRRKKVAWTALVVSSVPLHLFYNSVIFPTTSANNYLAAVVSPEWFTSSNFNATWQFLGDTGLFNPSDYTADRFNARLLPGLRQRIIDHDPSFVRMSKAECYQQYSQSRQSKFRNVIVVADAPFHTEHTLYGTLASYPAEPMKLSSGWVCSLKHLDRFTGGSVPPSSNHGIGVDYFTIDFNARCDSQLAPSNKWQLPAPFSSSGYESGIYGLYINRTTPSVVDVDHCFAEKTVPACSIRLSRSILVTVILANLAKMICFLVILTWAPEVPLVTVGDAIASFLCRPEDRTAAAGALSVMQVRNNGWSGGERRPAPFVSKWRFWFRAASAPRWAFAAISVLALYAGTCFVCALATGAAGSSSFSPSGLPELLSYGFGTLNLEFVIDRTRSDSLTGNVLLANMPQLLISIGYILINNILTSCLLCQEVSQYAAKRKPLRVTVGTKSQRTTYWLQIPYHYAIPLLAAFAGLHLLASQSIFLANVQAFDFLGDHIPAQTLNACGYSPVAVVFATGLCTLLIIAFFANGLRRYPKGMPLLGSCSAAISAACHPGENEGPDVAEWPLQYGVLKSCGTRRKLLRRTTGDLVRGATKPKEHQWEEKKSAVVGIRRIGTGQSEPGSSSASEAGDVCSPEEQTPRYRRVGFSSWDVEPLVDGEIYS